MSGPAKRGGGMALTDVVKTVICILIDMAQKRAWGEIRITVQSGQIEFVHESRSYRDRLPEAATDDGGKAIQQAILLAAG